MVPDISLNTPRSFHTSHVLKSFLYVIGGSDGTYSAKASIERAPILADNRLGEFTTLDSTELVQGRYGHTSVIIGSYLYVIGGWDDMQSASNTVERAVIDSSGEVGPFELLEDVTLETPRVGAVSQVIGNTLYVFGGDGNTETTAEKADILKDGTLSTFTTLPEPTTGAPRRSSLGFATSQSFYLVGGEQETSVERALIKSDRTLGDFSLLESISLDEPLESAAGLAIGRHFFILGGRGTEVTASVLDAPLTNGTLGQFAPQGTLTKPSMGHTCHLIGKNLYVIGGQDDLNDAYDRLEMAAVQ